MDNRRVIRYLSVLCALSVAAMTFALLFGSRTGVFVPPPFDPSAQVGCPEVPAGLGYQTLDAGSFRVALCGGVMPEQGRAVIYLTNPADNEVWLKLRILDEKGAVLGETGLVCPGEYVKSAELSRLPGPGDPITLKIMAYEPDSYHSGGAVLLNTHIGE